MKSSRETFYYIKVPGEQEIFKTDSYNSDWASHRIDFTDIRLKQHITIIGPAIIKEKEETVDIYESDSSSKKSKWFRK